MSELAVHLAGSSRIEEPRSARRSDEEVLAAIAGGDDQGLAELYDRYGRLAYGLAYRVLHDQALAEDAVQDAFLAIWRSADGYRRERAKPSTWILTLVHRRAVDLVRREDLRRAEQLDETPEAAATSVPEEADLREKRTAVQAALRELPQDQRQALELAYYGGFTQSELAEQLGVPLGTIKSRMFAGLTRLRELVPE
ncbi:MAG TPA: sigma-70 family RNA polymerase sigma factor [Gaiellaceae bacterium]|nr:sigma-70 family RNA polymerase sigma factor [Gaiellaceae bacterium]